MVILSWSPPDSVLHFPMKILSNLRNVSLWKNSLGSAALSNWWGLCTINGGIENKNLVFSCGSRVWRAGTQEESAESKGNWAIRSLIHWQTVLSLFFFSSHFLCSVSLTFPSPFPVSSHSVKKISLKKNSSALATHPHPYVLLYWNTDEDGHWTASSNPPCLCSITDTESKLGAFFRMNPITQVQSPGCWRLREESFPAPCFWHGQVMLNKCCSQDLQFPHERESNRNSPSFPRPWIIAGSILSPGTRWSGKTKTSRVTWTACTCDLLTSRYTTQGITRVATSRSAMARLTTR